jgi:CheY-like chemotaxis protein
MNIEVLTIVLVDDDEDDRLIFKEAIEEIKIKTKLWLFSNGEQLMDFLKDPENVLPHVVFLDLNMPVKNGMQCLKEIRQSNLLKDLSVAIYSTSSTEEDIENTFIKGANIYIKKPNDFNKLKQVLEEVLKMNWQYFTSSLNRDNFLLRI